MGGRRSEVGRVDLAGQGEEGTWIVTEEVNVEHELRIVEFRILFSNDGVQASFRTEIRNTTRDRDLLNIHRIYIYDNF